MSAISKMVTPDGAQYDIRDAAALKATAAAPAFSSESAYSEGDYATHDGLLYRATAARVAGAWNSGSGFEVFPLWKKANPYPFVTAAISAGTVTLQPFANNQLDLSETSGTTAFTVAFAASPVSGTMRDLWLVVKTGLLSPTVTWPSGVVAADDNSDNLVADALSTAAFRITECASGVYLVRRYVLVAGAAPGLPYTAEVEYLESTGTQYVDTGIFGNLDTVAEFSACATAADGLYPIFGARDGYRSNAFAIYNGSDVGYKYTVSFDNVYNDSTVKSTVSASVGVWVDIVLGKVAQIEDWVGNIDAYLHPTAFTTSNTLLVFAWNQNGTITKGKYKIANCKITQSNTVVRDFIPVRVGSGANAVGYFYDRANPTGGPYGNGLYDNSGTGSFTIGPDKT